MTTPAKVKAARITAPRRIASLLGRLGLMCAVGIAPAARGGSELDVLEVALLAVERAGLRRVLPHELAVLDRDQRVARVRDVELVALGHHPVGLGLRIGLDL